MRIHLARGAQAEAGVCARRIVELNDQMAGLTGNVENWDMAHRANAHVVLGETEQARTLCESLLQRRSSGFDANGNAGILALQSLDLDRAVETALAEKAKHPTWDGMDQITSECVINREFVTHPKVREYFLEEGKWVEFLAERVPEYAEYGTGGE